MTSPVHPVAPASSRPPTVRAAGCRILAVLVAFASGCLMPPNPPPQAAPPTPTPTARIIEEEIARPERLQIEIIGIHEEISEDGASVTVSGTLINRGNRATREVSVQVNAVDEGGQTVVRLSAVPSTNHIAPEGGTTTFTATFDRHPEVVRYNVEAVAK